MGLCKLQTYLSSPSLRITMWKFAHVLTAAVCIAWWGLKVRMEKFAKWWHHTLELYVLVLKRTWGVTFDWLLHTHGSHVKDTWHVKVKFRKGQDPAKLSKCKARNLREQIFLLQLCTGRRERQKTGSRVEENPTFSMQLFLARGSHCITIRCSRVHSCESGESPKWSSLCQPATCITPSWMSRTCSQLALIRQSWIDHSSSHDVIVSISNDCFANSV